eukprot:COSAG05_NODE_18_length_34957_cov_44.338115_15_plen_1015_part_00
MQSSIRDDVKVVQTRLNNEVAVVKSAMEDRLILLSSKVDRQLDSTSAQIKDSNDRVAEMAVRVTQLNQDMGDRLTDASSRLEEFRKLTNEQIQEVRQQSSANRIELEANWESSQKREREAVQTVLKQTESNFNSETKQLKAQQELNKEEGRDLCAEIRRDLSTKYSSLEAASAEQQNHFNGQLTSIQSRFNEKEAVLRSLVDDLTGTMVSNYRTISATQSASDAELASRIREHEIVLDRTRTQITEMCGRLDVRLSEQKQHANETIRDRMQEMVEQVEEVRSYINDRCSEMDVQVGKNTKEFEDRLMQKQNAQLIRLDEVGADVLSCGQQGTTMKTDIEHLTKAVADAKALCAQVGGTTEKYVEELRTSVDNKFADLQDKVRQDSVRFTTFAAAQSAKQTGLDSKLSGTAQTVADHREKFVAICQNLESEQRDNHRLSMDSLRQMQTTLSEIRTELETKMQGRYQHFTDLHVNLDHQFKEKYASQEMRINDQHQLAMDAIAAIELQVKQKADEHDQRFHEYGKALVEKSTEFSDACVRIEKQSVERENRAVDLIGGLASTLQDNKQEMVEMCVEVGKNSVDAATLTENKVGEQLQNVNQQVLKLQRHVDQVDERHTERENAVQSEIGAVQQQCTTALAEIDNRLSSKIDNVDVGLHAKVENLCEETDRQHQKAIGTCNSLDKKFATRTSMLHEKFGVIAELANTIQRQVVDGKLDIDTKFSERCNRMEERISHQNSSFTDLVRQLENSSGQKDAALESAVRGQYTHFTDAVSGLHQLLLTATAEIEEKNSVTKETIASNHAQMDVAISNMLEITKENNKIRDSRVQTLISALEARAQILEATLERRSSELADADERLQARMDANLIEIHRKTQKLETCDSSLALALDGQITTLRQGMDSEAGQWRRALAQLDQKVAAGQSKADTLETLVTSQVSTRLERIDTIIVTKDELSTKLRLVAMDMEEAKEAVLTLGETLNEQDSQLEQQKDNISSVHNEIKELAVELSTVEMAVQMGN